MQKAAELAQALMESEEYKAYAAARESVDQDEKASGLMEAYAQKERELSYLLSEHATDTVRIDDANRDLENIRSAIIENQQLEHLAETQSGFQYLMSQVNELIGQYINPKAKSSCGDGCTSCEGCDGACH